MNCLITITLNILMHLVWFYSCKINANSYQDLAAIRQNVANYVTQNIQTSESEYIETHIGDIDPRTKLTPCPNLEIFLPGQNRLRGNTWIGVRCKAPTWSILIPVNIKILGMAVFTRKPLEQGHVVTQPDIELRKVELPQGDTGVISSLDQVIGRTITSPLPSGIMLKSKLLKPVYLIRTGDNVKLVSNQKNFSVAVDGIALNSGRSGDLVKIKLKSGQITQGAIQPDGTVVLWPPSP